MLERQEAKVRTVTRPGVKPFRVPLKNQPRVMLRDGRIGQLIGDGPRRGTFLFMYPRLTGSGVSIDTLTAEQLVGHREVA